MEQCSFTLLLSWLFLREILAIVPAFKLLSVSICSMTLASVIFIESSSAIGTPWMTILKVDSCILRPWNALFQLTSLESRNVFAYFSVSNWKRMPLGNLLIPCVHGLAELNMSVSFNCCLLTSFCAFFSRNDWLSCGCVHVLWLNWSRISLVNYTFQLTKKMRFRLSWSWASDVALLFSA